MKETIDVTIRRWLRKWLGIESIDTLQQEEVRRMDAIGRIVQNKLQAALDDMENTRKDLIQRMDDLAKDIAESKAAKQVMQHQEDLGTARPAHVPFSVRRKQAEGNVRNAAAYLVPGKKPSA